MQPLAWGMKDLKSILRTEEIRAQFGLIKDIKPARELKRQDVSTEAHVFDSKQCTRAENMVFSVYVQNIVFNSAPYKVYYGNWTVVFYAIFENESSLMRSK